MLFQKMKTKWVLLLCFLIVGFGVGNVYAADQPDQTKQSNQTGQSNQTNQADVFLLGEIVVSAEAIAPESPASITEVTAEDIKSQNAQDIGKALELLPGVYFHQGRTKTGFYTSIRGFEQQDVLILLDGVPISVPYEGLVNLPDIPVQNIAKIKVIKGNASTMYGPNAMGGVINIITKKGGADPQTTLSYKASDYQTHHASATQGGKVGDFRYFIGGSHRQSDGYKLAETFTLPDSVLGSMAKSPANPNTLPNQPIATDEGKRENTDYDKNSLMFTGNLDINSQHSLGISTEYYNNEYGISPAPIYREHKKGFFYFPRYWTYSDWERYTINLIEESRITDAFRIKTRVYYDNYDNTLDIYDDAGYTTQDRIGPPSGESIYDDYSTGFNSHMFWDVQDNNQLRLGLYGKKDVHKENFQDSPYDRLESNTYSVALEDEAEVVKDVKLTAGCSYDLFDKKKRKQADEPEAELGDDLDAWSPLAGLSYQLNNDVNLFTSYARKVRFPTMRNLYADGVVGPVGDPNLKAEKADKYELGGTWQATSNILFDGAVFYNDVDNLINFDNLIGRFEQFKNVEMYGFELGVTSHITDSLLGKIGYTYLATENDSFVTIENDTHPALVYKPDEVPYRPEHKIDFDLRQDFPWGTQLGFYGSYISSQSFYYHADTENNQALVAVKKSLNGYWLLNLRLSHPITKYVDIELAGENLLNEEYETIYYFPNSGITGWLGISVKI
ncbi:MAG: TonB-dependent receptor [Desulfobacteraceae bacterium]|nr:MAG: TonB-dependent receptor [Desulfobacteraceae bacterium]